ncbi:hypothetical protein [Kluyvera sichuanensis]|uniref:hypothetical protein n=1 Tax=Kluyvera sichuanensis TaxID=2725494 RepID=UPI002FD26067
MQESNYLWEKLARLEEENKRREKFRTTSDIKKIARKVTLTGLVCGEDAIALAGVTRQVFYSAKRFNPREFPEEVISEIDGYIWYRKQDILDFFEAHPAKKVGRRKYG